MTRDQAATFGRRILRFAGIAVLVVGIGALGVLGWQWRASATVERVSVTGTQHAAPDSVRRLAQVDSGAVMVEVDPTLVSDRVTRHPWVKSATVTPHWMYGTFSIAVTERTPAALAVGPQGRPAYYLDRDGHAMPLPDSAGYDVPLIRGLDAEKPWTRPDTVQAPASLQQVLVGLPKSDVASLVAEIKVGPDGAVQLVTTPFEGRDVISVRLGMGDVPKKLRRLHAFARQVLSRPPSGPNASIEQIDLRFDGQVVTREQSPG